MNRFIGLSIIIAAFSCSVFAQTSIVKRKVHQCVLKAVGILESRHGGNTGTSGRWIPIAQDYTAEAKTRLHALASLQRQCLDSGDLDTLRIINTNIPENAIPHVNELLLLQNNLRVCEKLLKEKVTCEVAEESEVISE